MIKRRGFINSDDSYTSINLKNENTNLENKNTQEESINNSEENTENKKEEQKTVFFAKKMMVDNSR